MKHQDPAPTHITSQLHHIGPGPISLNWAELLLLSCLTRCIFILPKILGWVKFSSLSFMTVMFKGRKGHIGLSTPAVSLCFYRKVEDTEFLRLNNGNPLSDGNEFTTFTRLLPVLCTLAHLCLLMYSCYHLSGICELSLTCFLSPTLLWAISSIFLILVWSRGEESAPF